jgi:hypothetical protein
MCKYRTTIDKVEIVVLERKVGVCGYGGKSERRTKVLLAPSNTTSVNIETPNLTLGCDVAEASNHPACTAAQIQDATSVSK